MHLLIGALSLAFALVVGCGEDLSPERVAGSSLKLVAETATEANETDETIAAYEFDLPIESLATAPSIRWELPGGRSLTCRLERVERRDNGLTWFGAVAEDPLGSAFVTVVDGRAAGRIETRTRGIYRIRRGDGDRYRLLEIDQSALPDCRTPNSEPLPYDSVADAPESPTRDDGLIIRVLVVYNAAAAAWTADIDAEVQAAVDDANQVYADSGVTTRLQLAYAQQVEYAHSGDLCFDRQALAGSDDGQMDEVHALRDLHQADLVALLTEPSTYCGCAYIMEAVDPSFSVFGFSATAIDCAVGNHSFVHEIGHNQGMRHDWFADDTDNSPFSYNHGFAIPPAGWRTVMAYNDVCLDAGFYCVRLGYLSNPENEFGDAAMGIIEGLEFAADNHKVLNNTALTVANFRSGGTTTTSTTPTTTTSTTSTTTTTFPTTTTTTTTTNPPQDDDTQDDDADDDVDDDADDDTSPDNMDLPDLEDDDSSGDAARSADREGDACGCGC